MSTLRRMLLYVILTVAILLAFGITFTIGWRPFIGPRARRLATRTFERTPTRLARGQYLVEHVANCMECHAEHDWTAHDAPVRPNSLGAGQDMNVLKGFPGKVYAPNITPDRETGIGAWSDDQRARAIREGVSHDGRALFPFMPYLDFRAMSDEDLAAVIVYVRLLPPVRRQQPPTELIFPVNYLIRGAPAPLDGPVGEPDVSSPEKRVSIWSRSPGAVTATRCRMRMGSRWQALSSLVGSCWTDHGAVSQAPISRRIHRGFLTTTKRCLSRRCEPGTSKRERSIRSCRGTHFAD